MHGYFKMRKTSDVKIYSGIKFTSSVIKITSIGVKISFSAVKFY